VSCSGSLHLELSSDNNADALELNDFEAKPIITRATSQFSTKNNRIDKFAIDMLPEWDPFSSLTSATICGDLGLA